jgi:hypothetical protein
MYSACEDAFGNVWPAGVREWIGNPSRVVFPDGAASELEPQNQIWAGGYEWVSAIPTIFFLSAIERCVTEEARTHARGYRELSNIFNDHRVVRAKEHPVPISCILG